MTGFIKKYFFEKRIKSQLAGRPVPVDKFKNIFVLFSHVYVPDESFFREISAITDIPMDKIQRVGVVKDKDNHDYLSLRVQDINTFGKIKDHNMAKLFAREWDLFIDLTELEDIFEQLISASVRSPFRIGTVDTYPGFYDLMIVLKGADKKNLPENLKRYFPLVRLV